MRKKVFVVIFILFLFSEANAFSKDSSSKKDIWLSHLIEFGADVLPYKRNLSLPPNHIDSNIRNISGFKHSVYLNNKYGGIGGGLGLDLFTFDKRQVVAIPVYLSTKISSNNFPIGLVFKAGTYITQRYFYKMQFFDVGITLKPYKDSKIVFSVNYRNINYKYQNQRNFIYENLLLNVGFILD